MEENKQKENSKKLTYEQLEAYAKQIVQQAGKLQQENIALRKTIEEMRDAIDFRFFELSFKCLDHADKFSPEFIDSIISRVENALAEKEEVIEEVKPEE